MHPQDEESLQKMVGGKVPQELAEECDLRTRMFHGDGNSGPLGSLGLIDLVRFVRCALPRKPPPPSEDVDWRNYSMGTRVEARFFGCWQPAVFRGFVAHGTLAIHLDSNPEVAVECRKAIVRLPVEEDRPDTDNMSVVKKPSEIPVDVGPAEAVEPEEPPVEQAVEAGIKGLPAEPVTEDVAALPIMGETPVWNGLTEGVGLWFHEDGDIKDALFEEAIAPTEGDEVTSVRVLVDGEEETRVVPAELLTLGA